MNKDEERRRAVAAIDAQITALIEDGVPADSSRIRALKAKRAVAQKSTKAIKRTVRKAREREAVAASAGASGTGTTTAAAKAAGRIALVADSTADARRLQSLPAKERTRVETARIAVRQALTWCDEPSSEGVRDAIARCDADISALIDKGVRYQSDSRTQLRNRRSQLKDLAGAFASRRRTSPPSELELAFLLDAYLERRRQIRQGPENVVGVLDVRSGGAPSLGKRK
ncbi:hypothetical protein SAMN06265174_10127 [Dietzia kunjamensis subsp. schimae]|uniref:CHAD domain-containing protein n=1 Tax=Dietzia kunjamensis subsp. schimae TaxID=498198 RepID=A0ABY1MVR0_9ACTN|nr:hypothetical protein [Dietzia kunjamensis]MBB1015740.1 hypothetical protein [Dietzia kunjamensis subsp. schimae]SMO32370.1 hypothetical protein SAMN06265174_10127 [Dietzia kunjamensis subsp. schimae]